MSWIHSTDAFGIGQSAATPGNDPRGPDCNIEDPILANVLITDDHPFYRMGVAAVLEMGGHKLIGAANDAEEAFQMLETADPDILLLDIRLPGEDGITMLRHLRADGDDRRIIILTVEMTDEQLLAALQCKVDGVVFKHESEERFLAAIETVLAGGRYIDSELFDRALLKAGESVLPTSVDSLTLKERQVARLVADGLRNREIAKQLAITEGTVKVYLHKIYTKLGIANRSALAALAANLKP